VGGVDAQAVVALAAQGDGPAGAAIDRWLDRLARSLGTAINLLDPDVVVVGGGLSNAEVIYREVPRRWGAYIFSDRVDTRIVPAAHGDSSGVRGAARLWP
jgi:fructokinase